MAVLETFAPHYGAGIIVAPAAGSAASAIGLSSKTICLSNLGANVCYVRTGLSTAVATTADFPVLPGFQVTISKPQDDTHVAYISAAGTSLHIIDGEGF